jgi:hypothetical protein
MTATLTITPTSANISPPATSRCGLNETGICCKESETPQTLGHYPPVRYPEANYDSRPVCPDDPLVTQAVPFQQRAVPAISDCPNPTQGRLDIPVVGTPSSPAPGGTPVVAVGVAH